MGLADDIKGFREEWHPHQGPTCRVAILLSLLSDKERVEFQALLDHKRVYGTDIATMVKGWADRDDVSADLVSLVPTVKDSMIQRHRTGKCACGD